jgi:hypothetical protein
LVDRPCPKNRRRFEPLDKKKHDRAALSCEHELLDRYLKGCVAQEIKKQVSAVYVLAPDGKTIAGYTLSQYAIEAGELPPELVQQLHLPRYDRLPATSLGRLARSKQFKGRCLGELLLMGGPEKSAGAQQEHRLSGRGIWTPSTEMRVPSTDDMASSLFRITRIASSCP